MAVDVRIDGTTCWITLNNPPVNVLGQAVRTGLEAALDQAEAAGAERIILSGAGNCFAAGADAKEFDAPPAAPHLPDILNRMEKLPIIAVIHGVALGGGLELALAARLRIAHPKASVGLPEVLLGVIPGAGGTQRLPRLIGVEKALALIPQGRSVNAAEALSLGLIDRISDSPLDAASAVSVQDLHTATGVFQRIAPTAASDAVRLAREKAAADMPGQIAPMVAIDLVEASATLPLDQGLARERAMFLQLRQSPQAASLRAVFFAERAAYTMGKDLPAVPEVTTALVLGHDPFALEMAARLAKIGVAVTLVVPKSLVAETARLRAQSPGMATVEIADELPKESNAQIAVIAGSQTLPEEYSSLPQSTVVVALTPMGATVSDEIAHAPLSIRFLGQGPSLLEVAPTSQATPQMLAMVMHLARRMKQMVVLSGTDRGLISRRLEAALGQTPKSASGLQDNPLLHTNILAESKAMLADGTATRGSDINLILIHGFGLARWLGPMH